MKNGVSFLGRMDNMKKAVAGILALTLAVSLVCLVRVVLADPDCSVCTECAGDPVFVQRDMRNPELAAIVRKVGSPLVKKEGLKAVVLLSDGEGAQVPDSKTARSMILITSEGHAGRRALKGEVPQEIKMLVRYNADSAATK
jgi:hypothetical protein